jgi:hypothetical protein
VYPEAPRIATFFCVPMLIFIEDKHVAAVIMTRNVTAVAIDDNFEIITAVVQKCALEQKGLQL